MQIDSSDTIENAKRFLSCARECEKLAPNVSYVLATTALEEVGKSILKKQKLIEPYDERPAPSWLTRHSDDHQKKLFWAIWTPMLGNQVITGKEMEEAKELSISIHFKRVKAQYSDEGNSTEHAVSPEEVASLINLADARIQIEELYKPRDLDPERIEKMKWFLNLQGSRPDSGLIFGSRSMQKLSELGDAYKWVCWLKEQFDNSDIESRKLTESELGRRIDPSANKKIKWKMTVRFVSKSHSIKQGELAKWNEKIDHIKIRAGDTKKKELIVDFLLSDQFRIKTLWWSSLAFINHFLVALNVGTFGYFWWYMPTITERFYEELEDLENKSKVRIESHPEKPINLGNLALKKEDLNRVGICMGFITRCKETKIFDHYLTGLGFLAKSDVIMRFENNALESFTRSLQLVLETFDHISLMDFLNDPSAAVGDFCKDWSEQDRTRIKNLAAWAFSDKSKVMRVDPDDVGIMKILIDSILQRLANKSVETHLIKAKRSPIS